MAPAAGEAENFTPRTHGVVVLFLLGSAWAALRLPLLLVREPFFDELFTLWIIRKPPSELLGTLLLDSGPPLYYLLLQALTISTLTAARVITLTLSFGALLALLLLRDRPLALTAALLLFVHPATVHFSTEARAYGLAAALIGVAAVALRRWSSGDSWRWLGLASAAILVAAYSHYYAVLFMPVPLLLAMSDRRLLKEALIASAAIGLAFLPGLALVLNQPPEAIGWMTQYGAAAPVVSPLLQFGLAAPWPVALIEPAPVLLIAASALVVIPLWLHGLWRSASVRAWSLMVAVPALAASAAAVAGRPVYFPFRFESLFIVPAMLAVAASLLVIPLVWRRLVMVALIIIGCASWWHNFTSHAEREPDPFRMAAMFLREQAPSDAVIVASGPMWLEIESRKDPDWRPAVIAFPAEQELHPGWSRVAAPDQLRREAAVLEESHTTFLVAGVIGSSELRALEERFALRLLLRHGPVVVLHASVPQSADEHQQNTAGEPGTDPPVGR
jgi:hypothetical protein